MKVIKKISLDELKQMAEKMYGDLVKADVDVAKELIIIDMEMHFDGEAELLKNGSVQDNLWGINLYPEKFGTKEFIEFESMINIRPSQGNFSRNVDDPKTRDMIKKIINGAVYE